MAGNITITPGLGRTPTDIYIDWATVYGGWRETITRTVEDSTNCKYSELEEAGSPEAYLDSQGITYDRVTWVDKSKWDTPADPNDQTTIHYEYSETIDNPDQAKAIGKVEIGAAFDVQDVEVASKANAIRAAEALEAGEGSTVSGE